MKHARFVSHKAVCLGVRRDVAVNTTRLTQVGVSMVEVYNEQIIDLLPEDTDTDTDTDMHDANQGP